jgi:phosphoribosylamine--glycine ligase
MKVLVVGGGGREHALAWKLSQSPLVSALYCAPGNGGMGELGELVPISAEDIPSLLDFAKGRGIDLTVVGPEAPLVCGIVDAFKREGLGVFGPTREAAQMEGSKVFAKRLMLEEGIPTGKAEIFDDFSSALSYLKTLQPPVVVKADGLAAGKGVVVAADGEAAEEALRACMVEGRFGEAGKKVLIEEYLEGQEVSILALVDGETILPLEPAQDYKRVGEGDTGPNTGGMGSYSPVPVLDEVTYRRAVEEILVPTARALARKGIHYQGILYAGLILTAEGPKVLEFNVRFGDPETQAILPRLESDLMMAMVEVMEGRLGSLNLQWSSQPCVAVVVASSGYPGGYQKGYPIAGLEEASLEENVVIFHAGTKRDISGTFLTDGGRVLNVCARAKDFKEAREKAYRAVEKINFPGAYYRRDIALRAVESERWCEKKKNNF